MIHTNYEEVRVVARDIGVLCRTMLLEAREMEQKMNGLKETFCDDGFEEIERCLEGVFDAVAQSRNDMIEMVKILQAYASGLEASK